MGRPSIFSDEFAAEICDRLAGGESLNAICSDDHMPTRQAVHEWIADNRAGFGDKYARAREVQADHFADEIIAIVDTEPDANRGAGADGWSQVGFVQARAEKIRRQGASRR